MPCPYCSAAERLKHESHANLGIRILTPWPSLMHRANDCRSS